MDGEKIKAALNQFHARHNKYPLNLEQLIPDELPAIDLPAAGDKKWEYLSVDGTDFGLGFYSTVPPIRWVTGPSMTGWQYTARNSD
jgi:hypothetical protein